MTRTQLIHGGDLRHVSQETGIPLANWLDLSTGISPYAYPCSDLPDEVFARLPYTSEPFSQKVSAYYGSKAFVALPGTQAAIQLLPEILPFLPVLLPSIGYQEHALAWQNHGNDCAFYDSLNAEQAIRDIDHSLGRNPAQHLLIINPNNPTTLRFSTRQLTSWAQQLKSGACLVVDEAFIDTHTKASMIAHLADNIIVLRSFGKFFGLAGIRLGFIFASEAIRSRIEYQLPPWSINGPAAYLAEQALGNREWQAQHQLRLQDSEQRTIQLFAKLHDTPYCARAFHERLFSSYLLKQQDAHALFEHFYRQGVLLRLIPLPADKALIRIGRIQADNHMPLQTAIKQLPCP